MCDTRRARSSNLSVVSVAGSSTFRNRLPDLQRAFCSSLIRLLLGRSGTVRAARTSNQLHAHDQRMHLSPRARSADFFSRFITSQGLMVCSYPTSRSWHVLVPRGPISSRWFLLPKTPGFDVFPSSLLMLAVVLDLDPESFCVSNRDKSIGGRVRVISD